MSLHLHRDSRPWAACLCLTGILFTSACGDDTKPPTQPSPTPPAPPATVTSGRVTQAPAGLGLVLATPFTFTAEAFTASDNSALTFTWDFGDGSRSTGGTSVTHTYGAPGTFSVSATAATAAGQSATAILSPVTVVTVDGRWGLQDVSGAILLRNSSLTQTGTAVGGDDTALNCRFSISGSVVAPRGITLTWTRAQRDCAGTTLPVSFSFTGVVNETAGGFLGTLDSGVQARLVPCGSGPCG